MTNIELILAIGLLVALIVAGVSAVSYLLMRSEVEKYRFETSALTGAYEAFKKTDEDTYDSISHLHDLIDDVLDHDRKVIDENSEIIVAMARLQAETEALHDSIRKGFEYDSIGSEPEPDE